MADLVFNPYLPEYQANPYPTYARFRSEDPVHWGAGMNGWLLTRHADVVAVLKDPRFGRGQFGGGPEQLATLPPPVQELLAMQQRWMLLKDPPDHTRLRGLVNSAFTPRMVERLRPHIQEIADDLLTSLTASSAGDLIAGFAYPLPVIVIAELLGVPVADHHLFREWSAVIAATLDANESMDVYARGAAVHQEMDAYLREIVARRRKEPKEDLISGLIAAEEQGQKLTEDELIATCILLLFAGHETTVNLIGNSTLHLLNNPDQLARLREQPALMAGAVEELLRFDSPVQATARAVHADAEVGGRLVKRGQFVHIMLGAANRDPAVFADPDRLDITRSNAASHVSFAMGIHYCLGAPLARLEGQIALGTLLRRLPNLALATDALPWRPSMVFRGLKALPVSW